KATLFYFQRQSDQAGLLDTQVNGRALRLRIVTADALLTRVRVLGTSPDGDAVVLAESLRDDGGTLRWRGQVSTFDVKGVGTRIMQIDDGDRALPYGDYVVLNDQGELGLLHMIRGSLTVDWRKLAANATADGNAAVAPKSPATALRDDEPAPA